MALIPALCLSDAGGAATFPAPAGNAGYPVLSMEKSGFCDPGNPCTDDWVLCYESDQIYIYERWISGNNGNSIRERKGEMYVNCSFDEAVNLLTNYEKVREWTADVKENTLVNKKSTSSWITYTEFDLPWPFQNRDVVSEYTMTTVKAGSQVLIRICSVDHLVGQKEGITRIVNYKASWAIKRIDGSKTWICFTASCDQPPVVPRFIQDPVLRKTFHKNLLKLKSTLE